MAEPLKMAIIVCINTGSDVFEYQSPWNAEYQVGYGGSPPIFRGFTPLATNSSDSLPKSSAAHWTARLDMILSDGGRRFLWIEGGNRAAYKQNRLVFQTFSAVLRISPTARGVIAMELPRASPQQEYWNVYSRLERELRARLNAFTTKRGLELREESVAKRRRLLDEEEEGIKKEIAALPPYDETLISRCIPDQ